MKVKKGLKLTARHIDGGDAYHQGFVTKVAKDGVFYTGYPGCDTTKKWTPLDGHPGYYRTVISRNGRRLPATTCVDLKFTNN